MIKQQMGQQQMGQQQVLITLITLVTLINQLTDLGLGLVTPTHPALSIAFHRKLILATRTVFDQQERELYDAYLNRDSEFPLHKRFAHLRASDNIKDKVVREQINDLKTLRKLMPAPQLKELYGQHGELGTAKLSMIDNSNEAVQRRREPPPGTFTVTHLTGDVAVLPEDVCTVIRRLHEYHRQPILDKP